jgi:hypothetical protein
MHITGEKKVSIRNSLPIAVLAHGKLAVGFLEESD